MALTSELVTAHQALLGWAAEEADRDFLLQPVDGELRTCTFSQAEDQARRIWVLSSLILLSGC